MESVLDRVTKAIWTNNSYSVKLANIATVVNDYDFGVEV
jgi:hypothetical protein